MKFQWASATHTGLVRSNNQDSVHPTSSGSSEDTTVVMVADGMGGHVAGEVASQIAVDTARDVVGSPGHRVVGANNAILLEVAENDELAGMGTTLTLLELGDDGIGRFAHVGDSRAYRMRDGVLTQLTEDHTVVAEYIAAGKISPEDAASHPQRNMITRALGLTQEITVDEFEEPLRDGDRYLLCSDGVSSMLAGDEIAEILGVGTAEEAAWSLVEAANSAGGHDNISVVVVDVSE